MTGLEPFGGPLDEAAARHLLRRTAFGAGPADASRLVGRDAQEAVGELVEQAYGMPAPPRPSWADDAPPGRGASDAEVNAYLRSNASWISELRQTWLASLGPGGLRERMTLHWHGHFVTETAGYTYAVYALRYLELLRMHALGNFRTLAHTVGLTAAMLRYLDGALSRAGAPNENYARELLELFTMGPFGPDGTPNYSETDIRELSRALTGWQIDPVSLAGVFNPARFDPSSKTFLGRTGTFGYDEALDVVFTERASRIADFVARGLYRLFIAPDPDPSYCAEVAGGLLADGWEIAPSVRRILGSTRFFDAEWRGCRIKSPVEFTWSLAGPTEISFDATTRRSQEAACRALSQTLLDPPSVAGWPGDRTWLSTSLLPLRWSHADSLLTAAVRGAADLPGFADSLVDPSDPHAAFLLPLRIVEFLVAVPAERLDLAPISDPFAGNLDRHPVPDWVVQSPPHVETLAKLFLAGLPWYEWSTSVMGAPERLATFLGQVARFPEFQLT